MWADEDSDEQRRQVLALMARGLTDAAIAVRLRVSLRTVSRVVAGAMREAGAASRFQLGVLVGAGATGAPAGPPDAGNAYEGQ